ncbi:MAG: cation transporter [Candidatus Pacebacteria bacterium]|jgi:Co/Zn/Cd efflux system component|nr:cation transporter [Candidatus Paceibacterota bacterium]
MFEIITEGKLSNCMAPTNPCICKTNLLATTGTLALIAGFTQWLVGYRFSMAAGSDALHALSDGSADFVGVAIEKKAAGNPKKEEEWRAIGNKAISSLLILGAFIIGSEAYDRWNSGSYPVWLPAILAVGIFGLTIDLIRLRMLSKANRHSGNSNLEGLIVHARSDAWHSGIISTVAVLAMFAALLDLESGSYEFFIQLTDYVASLGLAGYMMFILSPRIWRGQKCAHGDPHDHHHDCDHKH